MLEEKFINQEVNIVRSLTSAVIEGKVDFVDSFLTSEKWDQESKLKIINQMLDELPTQIELRIDQYLIEESHRGSITMLVVNHENFIAILQNLQTTYPAVRAKADNILYDLLDACLSNTEIMHTLAEVFEKQGIIDKFQTMKDALISKVPENLAEATKNGQWNKVKPLLNVLSANFNPVPTECVDRLLETILERSYSKQRSEILYLLHTDPAFSGLTTRNIEKVAALKNFLETNIENLLNESSQPDTIEHLHQLEYNSYHSVNSGTNNLTSNSMFNPDDDQSLDDWDFCLDARDPVNF